MGRRGKDTNNKTETIATTPTHSVDAIRDNNNKLSKNIIVEETIDLTETINQESGFEYTSDNDINLNSETKTEVDTSVDKAEKLETHPVNLSSCIDGTVENNNILQQSPEKMKIKSTATVKSNEVDISDEKMKIKNDDSLPYQNHCREGKGVATLETTQNGVGIYEEEIYPGIYNNIKSEIQFIRDKDNISDSATKRVTNCQTKSVDSSTNGVHIDDIVGVGDMFQVKPDKKNNIYTKHADEKLQNASQQKESKKRIDVDDGGVYFVSSDYLHNISDGDNEIVSSDYLHNISDGDNEIVSETMLCAEEVSDMESGNALLFSDLNGNLPESCEDEIYRVDVVHTSKDSDTILLKDNVTSHMNGVTNGHNHSSVTDEINIIPTEEKGSASNILCPDVTIGNLAETLLCKPIIDPNDEDKKCSHTENQAPVNASTELASTELALLHATIEKLNDVLSANKPQVNNDAAIMNPKTSYVDDEECSSDEREIDVFETSVNETVELVEKPFMGSEKETAQNVLAPDISRENIKEKVSQIQDDKRTHVDDVISQVINENITEAGRNENKVLNPADVTLNENGVNNDERNAVAVLGENDHIAIEENAKDTTIAGILDTDTTIKPKPSPIKPVVVEQESEGTEVSSEDTKNSTEVSSNSDRTHPSRSTESLLKNNEIILNNLNNSLRDKKPTPDDKNISPLHIDTSLANGNASSKGREHLQKDDDEDFVDIDIKEVGGNLVAYVSDQNLNSLGDHYPDNQSINHHLEDELQISLDATSRKNVRHKNSMDMAREHLLLISNNLDESDDDSFFSAQSDVTITSDKSDIDGISYFTADADSASFFTADSPAISPSNRSADSFFSIPSPRGSKRNLTSVDTGDRNTFHQSGSMPNFEINFIDEKSNILLASESILSSSEPKINGKMDVKVGRETTV